MYHVPSYAHVAGYFNKCRNKQSTFLLNKTYVQLYKTVG